MCERMSGYAHVEATLDKPAIPNGANSSTSVNLQAGLEFLRMCCAVSDSGECQPSALDQFDV